MASLPACSTWSSSMYAETRSLQPAQPTYYLKAVISLVLTSGTEMFCMCWKELLAMIQDMHRQNVCFKIYTRRWLQAILQFLNIYGLKGERLGILLKDFLFPSVSSLQ